MSLGFTFLLVKVFTPEDIGRLNLFNNIVGPLVLAGTLRFEISILLPKTKPEARQLFSLAVVLGQLTALIYCVFVTLFLLLNPGLLADLRFLALLVGVSISALTIKTSLLYWFLREENYNAIAFFRIIESLFIGGTPLLFYYTPNGLVWGTAIAHLLLGSVFVIYFLKKCSWKDFLFKRKTLVKTIADYKVFPLNNLPQSVVDALQVSGVVYIISFYQNVNVLGFMYVAFRILEAPVGLIIAPLSQLFLQSASARNNNNESIKPLISSTLKKAFFLTIGIAPLFLFFGEEIVSLVKEEMRKAGYLVGLMSFWYVSDYLKNSVSQAVIFYGKQRTLLVFSVIRTSISLLLMFFGLAYFDFESTLLTTSIFIGMYNLFIIRWITKISH